MQAQLFLHAFKATAAAGGDIVLRGFLGLGCGGCACGVQVISRSQGEREEMYSGDVFCERYRSGIEDVFF